MLLNNFSIYIFIKLNLVYKKFFFKKNFFIEYMISILALQFNNEVIFDDIENA